MVISRKSVELPADVAQRFVADMREFFSEDDVARGEAIAARQMHALNEHRSPDQTKVRISDVKAMFRELRDHLDGAPEATEATAKPGKTGAKKRARKSR